MPTRKLTDSLQAHRRRSARSVAVAVVTLSTSRTRDDDVSGDVIEHLLTASGHSVVARRVIPDRRALLRRTLRELVAAPRVEAIVTTGGTGIAPSDITVETVRPLFEKELAGFATLFTLLSREQVGSAAMLSRATAGVIRGKPVFCLPGSPRACQLAVESLIVPELGHMRMLVRS